MILSLNSGESLSQVINCGYGFLKIDDSVPNNGITFIVASVYVMSENSGAVKNVHNNPFSAG